MDKGFYLIRKLLILVLIPIFLNAAEESSGNLTKQRIEVMELKKELNDFYNEKELEYQDRKKELENILVQIEKEKKQIKDLHDKNLEILQDIKLQVESKTSKIYNSMKPKNAADIFNQMISEGKIDDVFDIVLKLKESNVTQIMKFLSVSNASILTQMLENYSVENEKKD
jgi:flagellar motility protein MotE (MotC chaperone)